MYILSQILVVLSDLLFMVSMLNKKKKNLVFFLIVSTILFAAHYLCLGGYTGAGVECIEIVFLISMYLLEKKDKLQYNIYLSIITIILTIIVSILTWNTWISVFPMLAMIIYLFSMMFTNVIIVKLGSFIRLTLNGVYLLLIKSYFGAVLTVAILICTIIGIVNDYKLKQTNQIDNNENITQSKVQ